VSPIPRNINPLKAKSSKTLFINPPFNRMNEIVGGTAHPISKNI
jgi:hypothetical protein